MPHAGKILVRVDLQVGEGLVVAEVAVELRQDVLDQPGFHQQGVDLAFGLEVVDVADFAAPACAVRGSSAAALRK